MSCQPKATEISQRRLYFSLTSRLLSAFVSLLAFFFYAFPCFKYTYTTYISGLGEVVSSEIFTGYEAFYVPYFKTYIVFFLILSLAAFLFALIFFSLQIFSLSEVSGPNIILLGLAVMALEFMLADMSLGGYLLFALAAFDFVQYFVFLPRRGELDIWVFALTSVLILALLPSALALGRLFVA